MDNRCGVHSFSTDLIADFTSFVIQILELNWYIDDKSHFLITLHKKSQKGNFL